MKKLIFILAIFCFSCEEFWEYMDYDFPNISKFTVKVDEHPYKIKTPEGYEIPFSIQNSPIWSYYVLIDKNHRYKKQIIGCDGDWNKIGGITSEITNDHKQNSGMWAFKYYDSTLYTCPYTHDENIVHKQNEINYGQYVTSEEDILIANEFGLAIEFEKAYKLEIFDSCNFFIYKVEDQTIAMHPHPESYVDYYRIITSWFGGDCSFESILEDGTQVSEASIYFGKTNKTTKQEIEGAYELSKSNIVKFNQFNIH